MSHCSNRQVERTEIRKRQRRHHPAAASLENPAVFPHKRTCPPSENHHQRRQLEGTLYLEKAYLFNCIGRRRSLKNKTQTRPDYHAYGYR